MDSGALTAAQQEALWASGDWQTRTVESETHGASAPGSVLVESVVAAIVASVILVGAGVLLTVRRRRIRAVGHSITAGVASVASASSPSPRVDLTDSNAVPAAAAPYVEFEK